MKGISMQQKIQEKKYYFRYHYIYRFINDRYFSQVISYKSGYIYLSYLDYIFNRIVKLNFHSILDVGCADGRLLYEISAFLDL